MNNKGANTPPCLTPLLVLIVPDNAEFHVSELYNLRPIFTSIFMGFLFLFKRKVRTLLRVYELLKSSDYALIIHPLDSKYKAIKVGIETGEDLRSLHPP